MRARYTPIQSYSGLGQVRRERQRVVSWSLVPRSGYGILTPSSGVWQAMAGPIDVSATSHPRQSAPLFTTRPLSPSPRFGTLHSGFPHPNRQTPRLTQPPPAVPILRHIELNPGAAYCFQVCLQWRCATPIILGSYFTFELHHDVDDERRISFTRLFVSLSLSLSNDLHFLSRLYLLPPLNLQYSHSSRIFICFISFMAHLSLQSEAFQTTPGI